MFNGVRKANGFYQCLSGMITALTQLFLVPCLSPRLGDFGSLILSMIIFTFFLVLFAHHQHFFEVGKWGEYFFVVTRETHAVGYGIFQAVIGSLLSKTGGKSAAKSMAWLEAMRFFAKALAPLTAGTLQDISKEWKKGGVYLFRKGHLPLIATFLSGLAALLTLLHLRFKYGSDYKVPGAEDEDQEGQEGPDILIPAENGPLDAPQDEQRLEQRETSSR